MRRLPRPALGPEPNSRFIPSTNEMTNGASAQPVFTGTFGLDPMEGLGSRNCGSPTERTGRTSSVPAPKFLHLTAAEVERSGECSGPSVGAQTRGLDSAPVLRVRCHQAVRSPFHLRKTPTKTRSARRLNTPTNE